MLLESKAEASRALPAKPVTVQKLCFYSNHDAVCAIASLLIAHAMQVFPRRASLLRPCYLVQTVEQLSFWALRAKVCPRRVCSMRNRW